jgi:hypothetical protein
MKSFSASSALCVNRHSLLWAIACARFEVLLMNSNPLSRAAIGSVLALCSTAASALAQIAPVVDDVDLGDWYHHLIVRHTFVATDDEPGLAWSVQPLVGSPTLPATISSAGEFTWHPFASELYRPYAWLATVTDADGLSDTARLSLFLTEPEPSTCLLMCFAALALSGFRCCYVRPRQRSRS